MQRILTMLSAAIASLGLALGSASALAQKAETPKDSAKKADSIKAADSAKAAATKSKTGTKTGTKGATKRP